MEGLAYIITKIHKKCDQPAHWAQVQKDEGSADAVEPEHGYAPVEVPGFPANPPKSELSGCMNEPFCTNRRWQRFGHVQEAHLKAIPSQR